MSFENIRTKVLNKASLYLNEYVLPINQKKTVVSGLEFGVMNVRSLGSKVDYVIDHAKENKLDVVVL